MLEDQIKTSKTPPGYRNNTGSEGCFTTEGGNDGIRNLVKDVIERQAKLKEAEKPNNIEIEVEKRENVDRIIDVQQTKKKT